MGYDNNYAAFVE